jgi:SHS family lactate transporter-like MFS transporter
MSQFIGRRLTIIIFVFIVGAFIPLWILPNSFGGLSAGAFCLQFGVQGAWGVIPIQLAEMSPPGFRATFPGVTYQLGNVRRASTDACCVNHPLTRIETIDDLIRLCSD